MGAVGGYGGLKDSSLGFSKEIQACARCKQQKE